MTLKKLTLDEFREAYSRAGESVMEMAAITVECVTDDAELVALAQAALSAEDNFLTALNNRGIEL